MKKYLPVLAAALALAAPTARAQETAGKGAVNDALFAVVAAQSGTAEVQLSELGLQKATDPELKKFSQQMIDEHSKMNQELMALAQRKNIALQRTIPASCQFTLQSLAGLSGEEFDKCYAKAQTLAHMEAVAVFTAESERGQDADLKAFAAKGMPHIKEHLATIKPICERYEKDEPTAARRTDDTK
jgi:putative membrane protein